MRASGRLETITNFLENALFRVEIIYLCVLPYLGAFGIHVLCGQYFGYAVAAGWLLALMNIYIHLPMRLNGQGRKGWRMLLPLVPMGAAAASQGFQEGDLWGFFLDNSVMEAGALMGGFAFMFLFGKGISGRSAFKDLGIFMVLFVVALFLGSAGAFFLAWVDRWPMGEWEAIGSLCIGLGVAVYGKVRLIQGMVDGSFNPDDFFGERAMYLLLVIFFWMGGLPLVAFLYDLLK